MKFRWFLLFILMVSMGGCNSGGQPNTALKITLLPIIDVLPLYVAQDKGYFKAAGIQVEEVVADSAKNQIALVQAGEVDGIFTDLQTVALLDRESPQVKIVLKARKAYPEFPHFRIVAAPSFKVTGPADLVGVPIGISQNTIVEYLTYRLLMAWGMSADQIAIEQVPAITNRFEMLMNGQLKAALLPDPLGQAAIAGGGSLIVDDTKFTQYSQSIVAFNKTALANKSSAVQAFVQAWNKAVADINQNPNAYRDVLIKKTRVPPSIQGTYNVPKFPSNEITNEAEWNDVLAWMTEKGLLKQPVRYEDAVVK